MPATVAVTRPLPQAEGTARRLAAQGFVPRIVPLLRRERVPADLGTDGVAALAFTSRSAPQILADVHDPALKDRPVFCVGEATAREARAAGFAHVEHAAGDVAALAALIARRRPGRLVHLSGEAQQGDLVGAIRAAGGEAERRILYRMRAGGPLPAAPCDAVLLYSPRTAAAFAGEAAGTPWRASACVALSPEVAAALAPLRPAAVAARPSEDDLLRALCALPLAASR